jgi:hypothetical protein
MAESKEMYMSRESQPLTQTKKMKRMFLQALTMAESKEMVIKLRSSEFDNRCYKKDFEKKS